mmetsp:Transcript_10458/g.21137  ORF Transcript_10458/g.21137 Transcript_10458/m.21137 type:complete len:340 (+) Transcript_10458:125-1144(+)
MKIFIFVFVLALVPNLADSFLHRTLPWAPLVQQERLHHIRGGASFDPYTSRHVALSAKGKSATDVDADIDDSLPVRVVKKSLFIVAPVGVVSLFLLSNPSISYPAYLQDLSLTVSCAVLATIWLKIITKLASSSLLSSSDARKIIHTGSGPLFLALWPFFSDSQYAQLLAACVPLANLAKVYLAGTSSSKSDSESQSLAAAVSRSGQASEALGGPFIYTLVLLVCTGVFWRSAPAVIAVSQMAAGDGVADLAGRRWGAAKWPFSESKSYAGSLAFVLAAWATSSGLMWWMGLAEATPESALALLGISVVCSAVELVELGDDNWTVPIAGAAMASFLFAS